MKTHNNEDEIVKIKSDFTHYDFRHVVAYLDELAKNGLSFVHFPSGFYIKGVTTAAKALLVIQYIAKSKPDECSVDGKTIRLWWD